RPVVLPGRGIAALWPVDDLPVRPCLVLGRARARRRGDGGMGEVEGHLPAPSPALVTTTDRPRGPCPEPRLRLSQRAVARALQRARVAVLGHEGLPRPGGAGHAPVLAGRGGADGDRRTGRATTTRLRDRP